MNSLPLLAEHHCFLAWVDAVVALCDRLEASLITTRNHLLDAPLAEAMVSVDARKMERIG